MNAAIPNIILLICLYPILPILYFLLRNEAKPKKNIRLGVTLPYAQLFDPEVDAICAQFRVSLRRTALLLAPWPLACLFLPGFAVPFSVLLIWLIVCIIVIHIPYIKAHKRLRALKKARALTVSAPHTLLVDTRAAAALERPVNRLWMILAFAAGCVPFVYRLIDAPQSGWFLLTYGILALVPLLFLLFYGVMSRQRTEVVSEDSRINAAMTQIRRHYWSKSFLWAAWLTTLFNLVFWLAFEGWLPELTILFVSIVYALLLVLILLRAEWKCRRAQERLSERAAGDTVTDEDDRWILGLFYCNPDDVRTTVVNRVGIGTTVNMARPVGKIMAVFALVVLLALPCLCGWLVALEYTPLTAGIEDGALVVRQLSRESIPLEEIRSVTLLHELPPVRRIAGTGMQNLLEGRFDVKGIGVCSLRLDPEAPPFLLLETETETRIVNAGADAGQTQSIYGTLRAQGIPAH